ncbi:hypothetical protein JHJ32_07090 [Parapedobacter sp. ISTM3]|uniref:hypothetical protein n=1 Tax=Parapedobacter sp. ISTM3 TaxID=2800130 RepID=UPI001903D93A|nr:hypothetical protein [Parapedobacter sp. ISTM3]MBK1439742.1 hypothetical protein [Parapedobacter sp. ISTM3]
MFTISHKFLHIFVQSSRYYMSTKIKREIYAKLFFAIFFSKMVISTAPIFMHGFDRQALLQVVLQLEIENNNGKSGLGDQDFFAKDYTKSISCFMLQPPAESTIKTTYITDDERHIRAFYPAVPTPPPNC